MVGAIPDLVVQGAKAKLDEKAKRKMSVSSTLHGLYVSFWSQVSDLSPALTSFDGRLSRINRSQNKWDLLENPLPDSLHPAPVSLLRSGFEEQLWVCPHLGREGHG